MFKSIVKSSCHCYRHFTTMAALPVPALAPAVFPTPDLHDFKYSDLFKATENEISAIAWCQNNMVPVDRRDAATLLSYKSTSHQELL